MFVVFTICVSFKPKIYKYKYISASNNTTTILTSQQNIYIYTYIYRHITPRVSYVCLHGNYFVLVIYDDAERKEQSMIGSNVNLVSSGAYSNHRGDTE